MFDMEEKELNKLNQAINHIPKPETIDEYIRKGIALGIKKRKLSRIKMFTNIAAAFLIAIFITSIRTMPAFAEYVSKIPGLEYLVNFINHDKGLKSAVENNFIQYVNLSETHEDLTVTIKDVIMDNSKGIFIYSIENNGKHRFVDIDRIDFLDEKGEGLKADIYRSLFTDKDMLVEKVQNGKVEINFAEETVLPDKINIEVTLKESDTERSGTVDNKKVLNSIWKFELPVDKEMIKKMQKTYVLNQNIEVEGQNILFKEMIITPTRIGIDVEYDKNNTKKIFGYEDLKLINEEGEVWGTITNGVSATKADENHETLYFQSNYFTDPKELYLSGSSIRAVDKDKCTVEIDMESSRLLKVPDKRLTLVGIDNSDSSTTLNFNLKVDDPKDDTYSYDLFSFSVNDSLGNKYEGNASGVSSTINGAQEAYLKINKHLDMKSHLYLTLQDYPERIRRDFKVRIK